MSERSRQASRSSGQIRLLIPRHIISLFCNSSTSEVNQEPFPLFRSREIAGGVFGMAVEPVRPAIRKAAVPGEEGYDYGLGSFNIV